MTKPLAAPLSQPVCSNCERPEDVHYLENLYCTLIAGDLRKFKPKVPAPRTKEDDICVHCQLGKTAHAWQLPSACKNYTPTCAEVAAPLPEPTIKYGPIEAKFEQDGTKLTATGTFQAKVSPLPEIASDDETNKIRAYWRAIRGYCPRCNSDAPAIDTCKACENWRGSFPPPDWLVATWLMRHFAPKEWSSK